MRKIPNMSEEDVLISIEKIVNIVSRTFPFGYYELDDIKQEARLEAIKSLERYDASRPLENFLYSNLKNRLINFKRDNYERSDTPCKGCHNSIDGETEHPDGHYCEKYIIWKQRNTSKKNIINFLDSSNICDEKERNMRIENSAEAEVEQAELFEIIDAALPIELRATYLQIRSGVKVSKTKRRLVEEAVLEILRGGEDG